MQSDKSNQMQSDKRDSGLKDETIKTIGIHKTTSIGIILDKPPLAKNSIVWAYLEERDYYYSVFTINAKFNIRLS